MMLDAFEFHLANDWQRGFPLTPRPFTEIAAATRSSEDRVIEGYGSLTERGIVDRIGPVYRPNTVGASMLAAMAVPRGQLCAVAALVNSHPGVNHNYEREHRYNLWFVAAAPSAAGLRWTLSCIESATGIAILRLPLLEEFHIDLGFDLETHSVPRRPPDSAAPPELEDAEKPLAALLAGGLPLVPRPYAAFDSREDEVIATLERWVEQGIVRRVGAVVRHRRLGYQANAMVVWDLPDEEAANFGRQLAADPAVTLCYRRARVLPDWSYNLYCMVHGRERARVRCEIERISALYGVDRFARAVLFSNRCFRQKAANYG